MYIIYVFLKMFLCSFTFSLLSQDHKVALPHLYYLLLLAFWPILRPSAPLLPSWSAIALKLESASTQKWLNCCRLMPKTSITVITLDIPSLNTHTARSEQMSSTFFRLNKFLERSTIPLHWNFRCYFGYSLLSNDWVIHR